VALGDGPAPAGGVLKHFFLRISQLLSMKKVDRKQQKIQDKTKRWGANQPLESPTTRFRKSAIEKTPETTSPPHETHAGTSPPKTFQKSLNAITRFVNNFFEIFKNKFLTHFLPALP
jgi:hypothetical protein